MSLSFILVLTHSLALTVSLFHCLTLTRYLSPTRSLLSPPLSSLLPLTRSLSRMHFIAFTCRPSLTRRRSHSFSSLTPSLSNSTLTLKQSPMSLHTLPPSLTHCLFRSCVVSSLRIVNLTHCVTSPTRALTAATSCVLHVYAVSAHWARLRRARADHLLGSPLRPKLNSTGSRTVVRGDVYHHVPGATALLSQPLPSIMSCISVFIILTRSLSIHTL